MIYSQQIIELYKINKILNVYFFKYLILIKYVI